MEWFGGMAVLFTLWLYRSELQNWIAEAIAEGIRRGRRD